MLALLQRSPFCVFGSFLMLRVGSFLQSRDACQETGLSHILEACPRSVTLAPCVGLFYFRGCRLDQESP